MKNLLTYTAIAFLLVGFISCSKSSSTPTGGGATTTTFQATLSGGAEVPANASAATGSASLSFNNSTKIFILTVNYTGVTATGAHIHLGAAGVNGAVEFPLAIGSPINFTSLALTAQQEADLMANLYYVNIHSAAFAGGEIRGQLIKQ